MIIVIDTREGTPFFSGKEAPKGILTVRDYLGEHGGDYSLRGYEHQIIIERKEVNDFLSSITTDRERFYKTFPKLASHEVAMIVVEEELTKVLKRCDKRAPVRKKKGKLSASYRSDKRRIDPATVKGFVTSMASGKHGNIQLWFLPSRKAAQGFTLSVLSKFYERVNK